MKFVLFCVGIILVVMMAGRSGTRNSFFTAPPPLLHSCFDPDYPNDPNCIWTDADRSNIESFQQALTISQNRARTGKWIFAPKGVQ